MTALDVLLMLVAAAFGGLVANLVAIVFERRSSPGHRYLLWSLAFWSGPAIGAFTAALVATTGIGPERPPVVLTDVVRMADHAALGGIVVTILLIAVGGTAHRALRLFTGTASARRLLAGVRLDGKRVFAPNVHGACAIEIYATDRVDVPLLAGILRPAVLLPVDLVGRLLPRRIEMIVDHELVHARRRDNLRLWLEEAATALLWWSPAVRTARIRIASERETSCDEAVLARIGRGGRVEYARTLLEVVGTAGRLSSAYARSDANEMARRLRLVIHADGGSAGLLPLAMASMLILAIVGALPRAANGAIAMTGRSFLMTTRRDVSLVHTSMRDPRSGRPIFAISYGEPLRGVDRLLAAHPATTTRAVRFRRLRGGRWLLDMD